FHGNKINNDQDLRAFLHQCWLHFHLNSSHFADDAARIAFATSFLRSKALTWWLNIGEYRGYGELETNLEVFRAEIRKVYGDSDRETDAYYRITSITQRDSACNYWAAFS